MLILERVRHSVIIAALPYAPVGVREQPDVLQDLVAQPPRVEVVAYVLHEFEDELRLVQPLDVVARPLPYLPARLARRARRAQEGGRAVDRVEQRLRQSSLLKLVGRDLPDGGARSGPGAARLRGRAGSRRCRRSCR